MKIAVFGSTGFIGKQFCARLRAQGDEVIELDTRKAGWETNLEPADAVVNLAGASIFGKRWTEDYKKLILTSRTEGTDKIVAAMGKIKAKNGKAGVLVNASAVGYYGATQDEVLDENSPAGSDFLADVCKAWEKSAFNAEKHGIRTVAVRTGIVLGKNGGALEQMMLPFKLCVGGPIGNGQQWFPWIHLEDIVGIYIHALKNASVCGPLNGTAPNPVRNKEFTKALGDALHRPALLPTPAFALRLIVGEAAEFLVTGQRVAPKKTLASGYRFRFDSVEAALKDICA